MSRLFGEILFVLRVSGRLRLWRSAILTNSVMESTPRTPWSRKRKQQAKLQRMLDAKRAKVHTSPLPSTSTAPTEATEATSSGTAGQLHSQSLQDTTEAQELTEETLDNSFRIPVAAQPSDVLVTARAAVMSLAVMMHDRSMMHGLKNSPKTTSR